MYSLIPNTDEFNDIVRIIESMRERVLQKVNTELILMYRDMGEYISKHSEDVSYEDAFVQRLADFFSQNYPDLNVFNCRGLYRMKLFYELYNDNEKLSTLLTQLSWSSMQSAMKYCYVVKLIIKFLMLVFIG